MVSKNKIKKFRLKIVNASFVVIMLSSGLLPEYLNLISLNKSVKADVPYQVLERNYGCIDTSDESEESEKDSSSKKEKNDEDKSTKEQFNTKHMKSIYDRLHGEYGFSTAFIAGMYANWHIESNIDPLATQGDTGRFSESLAKEKTGMPEVGIGFGQWTGVRHTQLVDYAKKEDKEWYKEELQIDFMVKEDSSKNVLKELAKKATDDPKEETVTFHDEWEKSASSRATVLAERGAIAKDIYDYMKKNDMDGEKDVEKINKIDGNKGEKAPKGESSASSKGTNTLEDACNNSESKEESGGFEGNSKIGDSTKINGKKGKVIERNWEYDEVPEKYKKHISLPKFDTSYLNKPGNVFDNERLRGQCTELTWAYLYQLYGKLPPTDGNGNVIYKAYEREGAKISKKPTVGYGFSSNPPQAGAGDPTTGHTGVVVGVMEDGRWLMANYNVEPKMAPSRTLYISLVDGTDGNIKFFSGIGDPKKKK